MDPPEITSSTAVYQGNVPKVQIEWNPPPTLLGVNISNYTIVIEGVKSSASGNVCETEVDFPYMSYSQNQNICVAAITPAGMSEFACNEFFLTEGKN